MAHISVKSHDNGAANPKAHLRNKITIDTVLSAPTVAEPLGLLRLLRRQRRLGLRHRHHAGDRQEPRQEGLISVKALQLSVSNGARGAAQLLGRQLLRDHARRLQARLPGSRHREAARARSSLIEVHDCFSVTELVTMEDLHISPEGGAINDVLDGFYDADGKIPCQIDGGLKCFGHPIGASGLRMIYEMYLQMQGRAGARQRKKMPRSA